MIDLTLLHREPLLTDLVEELKRSGVDTIVRQKVDGVVYGLTYVDHTTKAILNGSDLGKAYSAKGILERCVVTGADEREKKITVSLNTGQGKSESVSAKEPDNNRDDNHPSNRDSHSAPLQVPDFTGVLIEQRIVYSYRLRDRCHHLNDDLSYSLSKKVLGLNKAKCLHDLLQ